jgi:hypothetical protein
MHLGKYQRLIKKKKSIGICTPNYKSKDEIKEKLGDPIFNRFDGVIRFKENAREIRKYLYLCRQWCHK